MTPDERIAAIRERMMMPSAMHKSEIWDDANWLFQRVLSVTSESAALRAVAEAAAAMPEPATWRVDRANAHVTECAVCNIVGPDWVAPGFHAPDCPWLLLQSALQRWREVQG